MTDQPRIALTPWAFTRQAHRAEAMADYFASGGVERRQNHILAQRCDKVVLAVRCGVLTVPRACERLREMLVPNEVARRLMNEFDAIDVWGGREAQ